ncbi:squalene/phytoene synthase family protein [Arenibaculum pallidiluteum]|uniref:squalene/phytoene synthase family protein n=1 Tax=Arenibaculum pallidiluteum TaxID=2812559 RepID=UPI001A962706|nr:squalene/phytoene synthase family protein [Arenibaculum pallidiluteum]
MTAAGVESSVAPGGGKGGGQGDGQGGGSTFYWPMLMLPPRKRAAIFAVYRFCRAVDDIADEPGDPEDQRLRLERWRQHVRALPAVAAQDPLVGDLRDAMLRYALPPTELEAVIDGVAMDIGASVRAPTLDELRLYCRRVAGAVGLLAIRIFDRADPETEAFAMALGEALQFTNILRDLEEDAAMGRLYLPRDLLVEAGIADTDPTAVLAHPQLAMACRSLAALAEARFAEAGRLLERWPRRRLWSARAMMILYRRLLASMAAVGWPLNARPRLAGATCAWVTFRCAAGRAPAR